MLYVKHTVWNDEGSNQITHVYEVLPAKALRLVGTYSQHSLAFVGFAKAIELENWLKNPRMV